MKGILDTNKVRICVQYPVLLVGNEISSVGSVTGDRFLLFYFSLITYTGSRVSRVAYMYDISGAFGSLH